MEFVLYLAALMVVLVLLMVYQDSVAKRNRELLDLQYKILKKHIKDNNIKITSSRDVDLLHKKLFK